MLWGFLALTAAPEVPELPVPLGSCSTPLGDSSPERIHNLDLAASRIDGTLLQPGERFSFNEAVGMRTAQRGYAHAPILLYGRRKTQVGGGICQLAGTLYNAALLSDLRVRERHRHTSPVNYLPLGQDATISWGSKDLVFENSLGQPVLITVGIEDEGLLVRFFGRERLDCEVHLETDLWEVPSPFDREDSEPGIEVTLYRVKSRDGSVFEREYLHRDLFPPHLIIEEED
jgi:vancomycin resistance protein YoaR